MNYKSKEEIKKEILTKEKVFEMGIEMVDDVYDYSRNSDRIVSINLNGEEVPIEGLFYEIHNNGSLANYAYYKDGFLDKQYVSFYQSGEIKAFIYINRESYYREYYEWHENGSLKHKKIMKYSIIIQGVEYDENGNIIDEKKEPAEWEIKYLEKLDKCYKK